MPCLAIQAKHSRVHCIPEKKKLHPTEMVVFPLFRTRTGHWMLTGLCASIFTAVLWSFNAEMSFFGLKNQSCSIQAAAHVCLVSELEKQRKSRQRCWVQNKLCEHMHCVILLTKKKRFHSALTSQVLSEYNFLSLSLGLCTLCVLNLCLLSQCATKPTTDDREQDRPANDGEKKVQSELSFPFLQLQCFWFPQEDDDRGEFIYVYPSFLIVQPLNIWQKQ